MKPAQDRLATDLERLNFGELKLPVVTNVDARITTAPADLRDALFRQVSAPVRWVESMQLLIAERRRQTSSKLDQEKFCQGSCGKRVAT